MNPFKRMRNWPSLQNRFWMAKSLILGMRIGAYLPWRWQIFLGKSLGNLGFRLSKRRRHITQTNIALCFPELDKSAQNELVRKTFQANGIGIFETAQGWCRNPKHFYKRVSFKGQDYMQAALAQNKGALIIGIHFSTLDLGGALHSLFFPADVVYRPHNNPYFERFMTKARRRIFGEAIDRHQLRQVIKRIQQGHAVWYSPDQDFGRVNSVFAPFFNVNAASIRLTAKIARITKAPIMPLIFHRNEDNYTYSLEYLPALENFPSDDDVADAARINRVIEQAIRRHPEQYLWMHRRFKTRPEGEAGFY